MRDEGGEEKLINARVDHVSGAVAGSQCEECGQTRTWHHHCSLLSRMSTHNVLTPPTEQ